MSTPNPPQPFVLSPADGERLSLVGESVRVLADAKATGGRCFIFEETTPPGGGPPLHRHAIEVRLNAEDPEDGFRPSPGQLSAWRAPEGVRTDTHVRAGYVVPPHYDSLLAKLIGHEADRPACIARLREALDELVVEGVKTTRPISHSSR